MGGRSGSGALGGAGAVLALLLGIGWIHAPALQGPHRLTARHDNLDGAAPLRLEAARQWKEGRLPLWNPYKRAGMPLLADTTAGTIYPGNFPFLFADTSISPAAEAGIFRAMDRVAALHALLAALFTYVFLRTVALSRAASVLGALVFAGCGTMTWMAALYIQMQNSAAWLPLILAAVHRVAVGEPGRVQWLAVGAVAIALQFFAGYPEYSFYSGLLAIAYALSLCRRDRRWQPVVAVAAVYACGLLLAAVQLAPSLELQFLSRRPTSLPLHVFQSLPASVSMLKSWWIAGAFSPFEFPPAAAYHFGAAAMAAALAGVVGLSRLGVFFTVVLTVGVLLAVGDATPVNAWAWHLPGLDAFRHPFKHLFEVSFAIAVLAAVGADRLLALRPSSRWPLAVVAVAVVLTCLSLRTSLDGMVAAGAPSVDTSGRRPRLADLVDPAWRLLTQRHYFQPRDTGVLLGDYPTQFRVAGVQGAGPFLWTRLALAGGMVEEETTFRRGLFEARDRLLALLSCRYVLQTKQGGKFTPVLDPAAWRPVAEVEGARLAERADALPRFRFVGEVRCSDAATMELSLKGGAADPRDFALVDCGEAPRPSSQVAAPGTLDLEVLEEGPGRVLLATSIPEETPAFLVVSQADFPGWKALADGREVPLRRVHGLVQGLEVPGGTRRVELRYLPVAFLAGATTSAVTLAALLLAIFTAQRRRDEFPPA
ncbi:MAG: YfhO family protein [Candidatus Binatia bacterium]